MRTPPLYAHRLGRAYGPDSSTAALAGALAGDADGLETDVCLTADGELILLHDPLLPLGTTVDGWAHERTAAEIRRGRLLDRDGRATAERPLTLDELLHAAPDLASRTAQAVCERYRGDAAGRRIEVISFHTAACATAAAYGYPARLV